MEEESKLKLFIGNLNFNTTEDQLREFYSQWGEVIECVIVIDVATKKSRGTDGRTN